MKQIINIIFAACLFTSCVNEHSEPKTDVADEVIKLYDKIDTLNSEIWLLKNRVTELEAKQSKHTVSEPAKHSKKANAGGILPVSGTSSPSNKRAPAKKNYNIYNTSSSSNSGSYSGQCQATTKKGYQCSRRAKYGSYCWQHSK